VTDTSVIITWFTGSTTLTVVPGALKTGLE
jgi:hypothetical protein